MPEQGERAPGWEARPGTETKRGGSGILAGARDSGAWGREFLLWLQQLPTLTKTL